MSSSGGPTIEIWKKWSITHSEAIPAWSASRAIARHVAPVDAGAPSQLNLLTCSPSVMVRTLRAVTAPASGSHRRSSRNLPPVRTAPAAQGADVSLSLQPHEARVTRPPRTLSMPDWRSPLRICSMSSSVARVPRS